jgi:MYXO-CTERM domain-containing protein
MPRMRRTSSLLGLAALAGIAFTSTAARADKAFVTLHDDGTIQNHKFMTAADEVAVRKALLALYTAAGQPLPDVLSVWTTFNFAGGSVGTIFDPLALPTAGIGLEQYGYPKKTPMPPLDTVLYHNNVLKLDARAKLQNAPVDGFARYLFLLELSHRFGPALAVPPPAPDALIGFPFHWSYWMDAGGSPSGGNGWKDNGDGTFSVVPANPKTLSFSMLDLYIMGLATKDEVPPFGVLENVVAPMGVKDPLWGGAYAAHSFPWFDAQTPFTVTATRRTLTIDDVITANGTRDPAAGAAPTSWNLGIVLLTSSKDDDAAVASAEALFDPIASDLAPAFHDATKGRGTLNVVTHEVMGTGGAGGGGGGGAGGSGVGGASASSSSASSTTSGGNAQPSDSSGCGCSIPGDSGPTRGAMIALAIAAIAVARRRSARHQRTA